MQGHTAKDLEEHFDPVGVTVSVIPASPLYFTKGEQEHEETRSLRLSRRADL